MNLGRRIAVLRVLRGLSQKELANEVGVSQGSIASIEGGGKFPRLKNLEKIALVLSVTSGNLLDGMTIDI